MIEAFEDEGCGFNSSFEQDRAVLPNYVEVGIHCMARIPEPMCAVEPHTVRGLH